MPILRGIAAEKIEFFKPSRGERAPRARFLLGWDRRPARVLLGESFPGKNRRNISGGEGAVLAGSGELINERDDPSSGEALGKQVFRNSQSSLFYSSSERAAIYD